MDVDSIQSYSVIAIFIYAPLCPCLPAVVECGFALMKSRVEISIDLLQALYKTVPLFYRKFLYFFKPGMMPACYYRVFVVAFDSL